MSSTLNLYEPSDGGIDTDGLREIFFDDADVQGQFQEIYEEERGGLNSALTTLKLALDILNKVTSISQIEESTKRKIDNISHLIIDINQNLERAYDANDDAAREVVRLIQELGEEIDPPELFELNRSKIADLNGLTANDNEEPEGNLLDEFDDDIEDDSRVSAIAKGDATGSDLDFSIDESDDDWEDYLDEAA